MVFSNFFCIFAMKFKTKNVMENNELLVNENLAKILKHKGFNEPCRDVLMYNIFNEINEIRQITHLMNSNWKETRLCIENLHNTERFEIITLVPTEHQMINWIFNSLNKKSKKYIIEWLNFWYLILIENNCTLMYEFIGRLKNWFEQNNIYLQTRKWKTGIYKYYLNIFEKNIDNIFTDFFNTRQEATHEGILKCFQLLNN